MSPIIDLLPKFVNWIFQFIPQKKPQPDRLSNIKIIAHRGAWDNHKKVENTFLAFEPCIEKKIWAIEFDIRWTKDNVPVIHHDQNLKRLFGFNHFLSEITFKELREIAPLVPSLEELIQRYFKKIHFMIELKSCPNDIQTPILLALLKNLTPIKDFHLMSLNLDDFKPLIDFPSETFVSIAKMNIKNIFNQTLKRNFGGFTGQYLLLSQEMLLACQKRRINVGTGFPDCKNNFYREVNRGVDWIFTNHAIHLSKLISDDSQLNRYKKKSSKNIYQLPRDLILF